MREAVIVAAARTAVGKANRGTTATVRSDELAVTVIEDLLRQTGDKLDPALIDDVIVGCARPEGVQGTNFARLIALRAGLPVDVPGMTVNRFCASGLQTIAMASERIIANGADIIIAGGAETMSMVPRAGHAFRPNPSLIDNYPESYISMGLTAEYVAEEFNISREDQDEFAYHSHMKCAAAVDAGKFDEEIVPFAFEEQVIKDSTHPTTVSHTFQQDEHLRRSTTMEKLARLPAVFKKGGSVTAGNSSPLSDGAAAVIVMEASKAAELGLEPLVRFVGFNVAGVRPEVMGIGPIKAVPRVMERTGFTVEDMDVVELNEAFASQSLAVIRTLEMDPEKVNVNGGAIALGHPLGATGAKLTVQIINELRRRDGRLGLVTMCIGGGMGAAGIFENLQ